MIHIHFRFIIIYINMIIKIILTLFTVPLTIIHIHLYSIVHTHNNPHSWIPSSLYTENNPRSLRPVTVYTQNNPHSLMPLSIYLLNKKVLNITPYFSLTFTLVAAPGTRRIPSVSSPSSSMWEIICDKKIIILILFPYLKNDCKNKARLCVLPITSNKVYYNIQHTRLII